MLPDARLEEAYQCIIENSEDETFRRLSQVHLVAKSEEPIHFGFQCDQSEEVSLLWDRILHIDGRFHQEYSPFPCGLQQSSPVVSDTASLNLVFSPSPSIRRTKLIIAFN